jgi:hypothetical protein
MPCYKAAAATKRSRSRALPSAICLLTIGCIGLVLAIEILNFRCGDAIARKMEQEPHSKWRILAPRAAWIGYERDFKIASGLDPREPLPKAMREDLENYAEARWRRYLPHHWLGLTMKWSFLGIPAGLLVSLGSLVALAGAGRGVRTLYLCCGMVGALTFLTCLLRYFPALGW